MILEVAPLQIRAGQSAKFELAFAHAQQIIEAMPGVSHYAAVPFAETLTSAR